MQCRHCKAQVAAQPSGPVIVGRSDEEKLMDAAEALIQHLEKNHPDRMNQLAMLNGLLNFFVVFSQFHGETDVKRDEAGRDLCRALIRKLEDGDIERIVNAYSGDSLRKEVVIALLRNTRDYLSYAAPRSFCPPPQAPGKSLVGLTIPDRPERAA